MKFEDLPEPKHTKIGFFQFLKETWYYYLIIIPFAIWNEEIIYFIVWLASWIS